MAGMNNGYGRLKNGEALRAQSEWSVAISKRIVDGRWEVFIIIHFRNEWLWRMGVRAPPGQFVNLAANE